MVKFLFLINVLFLVCLASCNKTMYVSKNLNSEKVLDSYPYLSTQQPALRELLSVDQLNNTIVTSYTNDNVVFSKESFDNATDRNFIGESQYFYSNGKLKKSVMYNKKNSYSDVKTYYQNGKLKRVEYFENMKLIKGSAFDSLGNSINYIDFQGQPYMDLDKFQSMLIYPENLKREKIEEVVHLQLLINKFGKIVRIKYDNGNTKEFLDEAINCFKKLENIEGSIEPGVINGKPIDCWVLIPVKFKLRD